MAHQKDDDQTPSPPSTSPGGQYVYPTPDNNNFYPPPLPALPSLPRSVYPPEAHHHGYFSHFSAGEGSIRENAAQLAALRGLDNYSMPRNYLSPYTPPTHTPTAALTNHQYYGSGGHFVQASNNASKTSPYFSSTPPLPPAVQEARALPAASPEDCQKLPVYRNSPYFSHEKDHEEPPDLGSGSGSSESSTSSTSVNRPVPAKSAFMCFSEAKGKEISEKMRGDDSKGGFVEAVAEWRSLSKTSKAYWEGMARKEKTRFAKEKEALCKAHKGPLARKLRAKKNPLAPKRPMSAFLMYAQQKRRPLQLENPDMPNADISRLLGELWRNSSPVEKRPFLEREEVERKIYKAKMEAFKNNQKLEKSMKNPGSARASYAQKKADERQDDASFTREESHSSQRFDPAQCESHPPTNVSVRTHQYQESHAANGDASPYNEYLYNNHMWAPMHSQQEPTYVKYTYPRPPEEHK